MLSSNSLENSLQNLREYESTHKLKSAVQAIIAANRFGHGESSMITHAHESDESCIHDPKAIFHDEEHTEPVEEEDGVVHEGIESHDNGTGSGVDDNGLSSGIASGVKVVDDECGISLEVNTTAPPHSHVQAPSQNDGIESNSI